MDADGGDPTQHTTTNDIFDAFPEWSPDGAKIAFTSDRAALGRHLGHGPRRLEPRAPHHGTKVDERPDWSPDGSSITFSRNGKDIWSMDADGSNQTQLTQSDRIEFGSVFSPDGTMIAFDREGPHDRFGVWVMPADGSSATRLTSGRFDFFPDRQPVESVG
jgi:Tol biopolymer transport system component